MRLRTSPCQIEIRSTQFDIYVPGSQLDRVPDAVVNGSCAVGRLILRSIIWLRCGPSGLLNNLVRTICPGAFCPKPPKEFRYPHEWNSRILRTNECIRVRSDAVSSCPSRGRWIKQRHDFGQLDWRSLGRRRNHVFAANDFQRWQSAHGGRWRNLQPSGAT